MDETLEQARVKLVTAGRILASQGQGEWTRGHVSLRRPDAPDTFLMKPKPVGLNELTVGNLVTCDLDGEKIEGEMQRHSEVHIHAQLYRARPEITAVVHAHPLHAVVFSALGRELQPIGLPGACFADGLPNFGETNLLISTPELGAAMARCMGGHKALLLQNHGAVVAGETIEEAIYLSLALETACQMQILADSAGGAKLLGSREEVLAKREHMLRESMFRRTFAYLAREAGG